MTIPRKPVPVRPTTSEYEGVSSELDQLAPAGTKTAATASKDLDQGPRSLRKPPLVSRLNDWWLWEIASAALSLAAVASICGVLIAYDQKPAPKLPHGITLNAVISLLATLAKASLVVVVAAAISQSKWLWFQRASHQLQDVQRIDDASRGPLGSFTMLLRGCGSYVAWLGAAITICTIFFEAFIQQLIIYPTRAIPLVGGNDAATLRAATTYNYTKPGAVPGFDLDFTVLAGVFGGSPSSETNAQCPGGNCVWPHYHSLALCTRCADVTDRVVIGGDIYQVNLTELALRRDRQNYTNANARIYNTTFTLPSGRLTSAVLRLIEFQSEKDDPYDEIIYVIEYPHKLTWDLVSDNPSNASQGEWTATWNRQTIAGIDGPLFGFGYLVLDLDLNAETSHLKITEAQECAMTPCVHEYERRLSGGQMVSKILTTHYGAVNMAPYTLVGSNWTAYVNKTDFIVDDSPSDFLTLLSVGLYNALIGTTSGGVQGLYEILNGTITSSSTPSPSNFFNYFQTPWSSTAAQAIDAANNISQIVENVGLLVTEMFQQYGGVTIGGQVLQTQTYVSVRWLWFTFPIALILLGIVTLLTVIWQTRRSKTEVWKSSVMPYLYRYDRTQYHEWGGASKGSDANKISYAEIDAQAVLARLTKEHGAPGLWVLEKQG